MSKWIKRNWVAYLFLTPWLIGLLGFIIMPMFTSFYLSFTHYDILTPPHFIGFENYTKMFMDKKFIKSLSVTFKFVFFTIPLRMLFALFIAMLLNRKIKGINFLRGVYYIPSLLGGSVAISILWRQIFNKEGLLNLILSKIGVEGINWIATPSTALYAIIMLMVWQFGSSMLIFLAALKQVPQELYEAADIDGARSKEKFFSITIPMITPMILFNLVMTLIAAFQSFTPAFIISGGKGGPLDSTLLISLYLYKQGFKFFHMGYASALAWILLIIIAFFTAIIFWSSRRWVYYER